MKRVIFILLVVFTGGFLQAQELKDIKWKYNDGKGDGFDVSVAYSYIIGVSYPERICEGGDALVTIQMGGGSLFAYKWYEVGKKSDVKSTTSYMALENCTSDYNGKKYLCEVTDLASGEIIELEDTVVLQVVKAPAVTIVPAKDTTVCYGETIRLTVKPMNDEYFYTWSGKGTVGDASGYQVDIRPEESTTYEVTVSDGTCAGKGSIKVGVRKPEVKLSEDIIYVGSDGMLNLTPVSDTKTGIFNWQVGNQTYKNRPVLNVPVTQMTTAIVTLQESRCKAVDSCLVVPELAFGRYIGGEQDGYAESKGKMKVSGITPVENHVCMGGTAYFSCNVDITSTFLFQWWKVGKNGSDLLITGATEQILAIDVTNSDVAGQYYCVVTDQDSKDQVQTDPVTLHVYDIPEISIVSPDRDTAICLGEQIKLRADRAAMDGERLLWSGYNILTNPTYQEITVAPTDSTVYELMLARISEEGNKIICRTTQEVKIDVRKVDVEIEGMRDVLLGESTTFEPELTDNAVYTWKTSNGTKGYDRLFTYAPQQNETVYLSKRIGKCTVTDSCQIFIKEYGVGSSTNQNEDGYTESVLPFYIQTVECPQVVCEGDEVFMNVQVYGFDVFEYAWKKKLPSGKTLLIDTTASHTIAKADLSDGGTYFCEVREVRSGKVLTSEEVTLTVLTIPDADIQSPANGKWICKGESIELKAFSSGGGVTYLWEGINITGAQNTLTTTVAPTESTTYSLVVDNGTCSSVAYVLINVLDVAIDIPEVVYANSGSVVNIKPSTDVPDASTLTWYWETANETAKEFKKTLSASTTVRVVLQDPNGCSATDSTRVYIRSNNAFRNGEEDGYVETNVNFRILEFSYPSVVCENADAEMSIRLRGSGVYSYAWREKGSNDILSTEATYQFPTCQLADAGRKFYCDVTDLMAGTMLTTDTMELVVRKGPKAVISYPERGKRYCAGTVIKLDARETENSKESDDIEFVYSWEGGNIEETENDWMVNVSPKHTEVYTLKVAVDGCVDYDTISIFVLEPKVTVPSVLYATEGESLTVKAEVSDVTTNATINWWHDAFFVPVTNPYTVKINQSAILVAEVVEEGCVSTDTARVYVRSKKYFSGGDDDGFMESCDIPVIRPNVNQVLGCGGADSVSLVVEFDGSPNEFRWQKLDEVAGMYVDVPEPSDKHIQGLATSVMTIHPLTGEDYGKYRCVLNNDCGSVYSLIYTVANGDVPQLAVHSDTMTFCEGMKKQQIVIALSDESLSEVSYRWYKKNVTTGVKQQFTPEESYDALAFVFPEIAVQHDALYFVEAENACGVTVDSVRLLVTRKVSFERQPNDTLVCVNTPVNLSVRAKDGGSRAYELKKVIPDKSVYVGYRVEKVMAGNGSNTFVFPSVSRDDEGYYVWTVKANCGDSITSNMFKLTVNNPLQFVYQTPDTTLCYGTTLHMEARAESPDCPDSKIIYSWEKVGEGLLPYATPTVNMTFAEGKEGSYICRAQNVCGVVSLVDPIDIGAHPALAITKMPTWESASICEDGELTLDFAVNYPDAVDSIRWFRKVNNIYYPVYNSGTRITGADDYILNIDSIRTTESGEYRARAYNVCGVFETGIGASIKVDEGAKIVKEISDFFPKTTVCQGEEADLRVEARGEKTLIYTWFVNEKPITGADKSVYHVTFDSTAVFECKVHNHCSIGTSRFAVSVIKSDTFRLQAAGNGHYCEGDAGVNLQLVGSDTNYTYKLYREVAQNVAPQLMSQQSGKDAAYIGGPLDFGTYHAGTYYVRSYNSKTLCEAVMPGVVTIVEDTLPPIFDAFILDPICAGDVAGVLALDSSIYTKTQIFQYTLKQKQNDNSWKQMLQQPGNGDTLVWAGVVSGVYRIEAVNRETKCAVWMNNELDLQTRPLPQNCTLSFLKGDSVYCSEDKVDIALQMRSDCVVAGLNYTLRKDGALQTEMTKTQLPVAWDMLQPAKYSVEIKNEWGCAVESNEINIRVLPVPAKKTLKGDTYYCKATVADDESTKITVAGVDPKIKYEFFREGKDEPLYEQYKGSYSFVELEVGMSDAVYYVVATDTSNGCSTRMSNTVFVKGSGLNISHDPIVMDRAETEIRLDLIVKDTIGSPKITWKPQDQVQDMTNPKRPWMDMSDLSKNQFLATVTDSACSLQLPVIVTFKGDDLTASIKDPKDCTTDIPKDTLWLCAGANFSLCGNVTGGNGVYGYEWKHNNVVLGSSMGLSNVSVDESGYLVFRVGSGGRIASDTIWLEVYPAPGKGLILPAEDMCAAPGQNIEMAMQNTKNGVTYSLEYSKTGEIYSDCGVAAVGDATGELLLKRPFSDANAGYYRVKATLAYGTETCTSTHYGVQVRRGTYKGQLSGGGEYCARPSLDTILLDTTEKVATYRLLYKAEGDAEYTEYSDAGTFKGTDHALTVTGNFPSGTYVMVAERPDGVCVDTMKGEVVIRHLERPNPGELISDPMEYCLQDGSSVSAQISLRGCESGNSYKLYRQTSSGIQQEGSIIGKSGEVIFGMSYNQPGRYFSVADNGSCRDTAGYVLIGALPEDEIAMVKSDTGYCSGDSEQLVNLKIYPVEPGLHYYIAKEDSYSYDGEFLTFRDDTAYYSGTLTAGNYLIKAVVAACEKVVSVPLVIREYPLPEEVELMTPLSSCEGASIAMGVESSQIGILYELYSQVDAAVDKREAFGYGDGNALKLADKDNGGIYYIRAEDTLTHCVRVLKGYGIEPAPKQFDFVAVDTSYCAYYAESGTQLALSGTEFGVNYILQKYDTVAKQFADIVPQVSITGTGLEVTTYFDGVFKAGKYRVRTNTCGGGLIGDVLEVKEIALPDATLAVNIGGKACVDSTMNVVIVAAEKGVEYSLWMNDNQYGATLTGTGADAQWNLTGLQSGDYEIYAERKGDNNASCPQELNRHIQVRSVPVINDLTGTNQLCEFADAALKLMDVEANVNYWLMDKVTDDTVSSGDVSLVSVQFTNVGPGSYYAVAENGDCRAYSPDFEIQTVKAPQIDLVQRDYEECVLAGKGAIKIPGMSDTLAYYLKIPDGTEERQVSVIAGVDYSFDNLGFGEYYLRVQDLKTLCFSEYDTLALHNAVPVSDTLIGTFGYCKGEMGARLTMAKTSANVSYSMTDAVTGDVIESIYGGIGKSFTKYYVAGNYLFTAEREGTYGGCKMQKEVTIVQYEYPVTNLKVEVAEAGPFCAGNEYHITVKDAETGVDYILRRDEVNVDTVSGSGDLNFAPVNRDGYYTVLPKAGGVCGKTSLDTTILINKLPKAVYADQPCSYCNPAGSTDEVGAELHLYDGVEGVRYVLTDGTNHLDTVEGNYDVPYVSFKAMPAAEYYIWAEDLTTKCSTFVDTAEITKGTSPVLFTTGEDGKRCGAELEVATIDGSESGVEYYLYRDGVKVEGPVVGTGGNITFDLWTDPGIYKIYGQYAGGCGTFMNDSISIHETLINDTISVKGSYCENGDSDIAMRLRKSLPHWRYFIEKDGVCTDTLAGTEDDTPLRWSRIGEKDMRAGIYRLYALNTCEQRILMDTVLIDTNYLPKKYAVKEGSYTLCRGSEGTITLVNSSPKVAYDLTYNDGVTAEKLLATVEGTDGELLLSKITEEGTYTVVGRMLATGCMDTMDVVKVRLIDGIPDPGVIASDLCQNTAGSESLTVELGSRQLNDINYYLQRLTTIDTVMVDSIKPGTVAEDIERHSFKPQSGVGVYKVVAVGPSCSRTFPAAQIGKKPFSQQLTPTGTKAICKGGTVELELDGSEKGVTYELYSIKVDGLDSMVNTQSVYVEGTGSALKIASVAAAGRYIVKAKNGCVTDMTGELKVEVNMPHTITLEPEGYTICAKDDSVKIEILGRTNPNVNAYYLLYPPGVEATGDGGYKEVIQAGENQASVSSTKWYKEPGYYKIYQRDATNCPVLDSVKVEVLPLPNTYTLGVKGSTYICGTGGVKQLFLDGAQANVDYHLYRKDGESEPISVTMISSMKDQEELVFEVSAAGTYIVKAVWNNRSKGCPAWMDGEVTLTAASMAQYKLEAVKDAYCERPSVTEKGQVKLVSSNTGISYQLYKDGAAYGEPKMVTVAGTPIIWDQLPGGMPQMSASQKASPAVYTVVGTDLASTCQIDMLGAVEVTGERTIVFSDAHMAEAVPKCIGEKLRMEVVAYGGKIAYSWVKDGNALTGANAYWYAKENMEAGDIGNYYCVMENTCGKDSTRKLSVVPSLLVEKTKEGIDTITLCDLSVGEKRKQQLMSSVLNASQWEWYKDDALLSSETNKWIDVNVSLTDGAGVYTCKAYNNCGVLWDTCVIMVDSTPRIELAKPAVIDTLCYGSEYKLSVVSAYPVNWMKGSTDLGITGENFTLPAIVQSDAGVYYAEAKNGCGAKKVQVGTLVVDDTVKMISENKVFRFCRQNGEKPKLFIQTLPQERVTYRWEDQAGNVLSNTRDLMNIDLTKYNQPKEIFRVHYQNKCNSEYEDMKLLVSDKIQFEQPVKEIGICVSSMVEDTVLRVKVDEPAGITYKWYYSGRGASETKRDSVGNADTLKLNVRTTKAGGYYYCYLANMCVDTTSQLVSVRVDTTPELKANLPLAMTKCAGDELSLNMKGNGGSITYTWYVKKKDKLAVKVLGETYFGDSESNFKTMLDTTYNGALVWCDLVTSCETVATDTLHLTIQAAPVVTMTPAYAENCEGVNSEIYVTLEKGTKPWKYKYSVDGVEESDIRSVEKKVDTLKISSGGTYRVYWLSDQKCPTQGKELAVAEYKTYKVSDVSMIAENYTGPVCPGDTVTLKITIGGTVNGPWNVEIRRKSDGELASELGFDNAIYTSDREYSCKLKVMKEEEYFARVTNVFIGGMECEAKNLTAPVKIEVKAKPELTMNTLTPEQKVFSRCQSIDLSKLFNVSGNIAGGGYYTVDGMIANGDWILDVKEDQDRYKIGYRIYNESCLYEYSLGELEVKPRPEIHIEKTMDVLCNSMSASNVTISGEGEYPLKVTYRVINVKRDGTSQLQTTVPGYELKDASPLTIRVNYEEELSAKIFEITRVEDKYKCTIDDLTLARDTVYFAQTPKFKLYSKVGNTLDWKTSVAQTYTIRTGDSVDVRVDLLTGTPPWKIRVNEAFNSTGYILEDIQEREKEFELKKAGLYEVAIEDNHCASRAIDYNPSIEVRLIDTAYLKVKAYLQGPWDGAKMKSSVLSKINKRGMTNWPNVGSKAIIDWVEIELWTEDEKLWDTQACLLLDDGTIVDRTGSAELKVIGRGVDNYRVAIRPRNHLATWSKAVNLENTKKGNAVMVDFTKPGTIYVQDGETSPDNYVFIDDSGAAFLYGGDVNENRLISAFDPNKIARDLLSVDQLVTDGEVMFDINYNGKVEWPGYNVDPTTGTASKADWAVMFKNRLKRTLVPKRTINWEK